MNVLSKISSFLVKETPWFVLLAAVLAYFTPDLFSFVHGDTQTVILGLIMLTMGMTLTVKDFKVLASRPQDILIGTVAQYTLMPLIAFTVSKALGLSPALTVGLILVGCSPGGVSSNLMTFLCQGDVAFSVGMTTASTLLSPLLTPLLVLYLAGEQVDVDAVGMFKSILIVTIGPVTLGFLLNHFFGEKKTYKNLMGVMPAIAVICLAFIVGGVSAKYGKDFLHSGWLIMLAVFLHNTLGYITGYLAGVALRFTRPKNRTISIEVGMQNAGLATVLAGKHFPTMPDAAVICAVSCVWHSITGAFLAAIFNWIDKFFQKRQDA
ncbi:bile acid:sodium symporter family protein [bacterium]|nr:bile acid:sodium symporter family protein [bacterium]